MSRYRNSSDVADAIGAFIGAVILFVIVTFASASLAAWLVMIGLGNLHVLNDWWPAWGFWSVFSFTVPLSGALGMATKSTSTTSSDK